MTAHLRPTATIAADVLLPGDPALALALAQRLLDKPLMANHSHGLWGYSGRTAAGRELTIQSTGIGGPSAAVVLAELAQHGARRAIRVAPCRALGGGFAAGTTVIVAEATGADGVSRALGLEAPLPNRALTAALARAAAPAPLARVASFDLPPELCAASEPQAQRHADAALADLETAGLLALAARLELQVACGLVVAGPDGEERNNGQATERALLDLGAAASNALAEPAQTPASATSSLL